MSELQSLVAQTSETVQALAMLSGEIAHEEARVLIAEVETQILRVEREVNRITWQKAESDQQTAQADRFATGLQERHVSRAVPPKRDVRQTMRMVSEFYERVSQERSQTRRAA